MILYKDMIRVPCSWNFEKLAILKRGYTCTIEGIYSISGGVDNEDFYREVWGEIWLPIFLGLSRKHGLNLKISVGFFLSRTLSFKKPFHSSQPTGGSRKRILVFQ